MSNSKYILCVALTVLVSLPLLFGATYILLSDSALAEYLIDTAESATGARISHRGDITISRTLRPTLHVAELEIASASNVRIQVKSLELQIRLLPMLAGRLDIQKLYIGEIGIEVPEDPGKSKTARLTREGRDALRWPLRPVIHDFQIGQVYVMRAGRELRFDRVEVRELALNHDAHQHALTLTTSLDVAGTRIDVAAVLHNTHRIRDDQQLPYSVTISSDRLNGGAEGRIILSTPAPTVEGTVQLQVPELADLVAGIEGLPLAGKLSGQARIKGAIDQVSLEDLAASWQRDDSARAELSGRVGNIADFKDVELALNLRLVSPAWLTPLLTDRLDPMESLTLSATLGGGAPRIGIDDFKLDMRTASALELSLSGALDLAVRPGEILPANLDLKLAFSAPTTRAARALLFEAVPELGPVTASADVRSTTGDPSIRNIAVRTEDQTGIHVDVTGDIQRFPLRPELPKEGYDLAARVRAPDAETLGQRLALTLPALSPFSSDFTIRGSSRALRIEAIQLAGGSSQAVHLQATGKLSFGDWNRDQPLAELELVLSAGSPDASTAATVLQESVPAVKAITDADLIPGGAVTLDGTLTSGTRDSRFDGKLVVGDMTIEGVLTSPLQSTPPRISGNLTARNVWLPDPISEQERPARKNNGKSGAAVFSRTPLNFDWLDKADLKLAVDARSFDAGRSLIQSAQLEIAMASGRLSITPAQLVYAKGALDLNLSVDGRNIPRIRFQASGDDLDPWQTLRIKETGKDFHAEMAVDISIDSHGTSPHELAANANGNARIFLTDGQIPRALIDLVFVDVVGWTFNRTTRRRYLDVDCGVAEFGIKQGVITTDAFFIDAPNLAVTGDGKLDLAREQIDFVFLPRKKTQFVGSADPVKMHGPLSSPKVSALPWKSAAKTYGGLLFAPQIFIPLRAAEGLLGSIRGGNRNTPCKEYKAAHETGRR